MIYNGENIRLASSGKKVFAKILKDEYHGFRLQEMGKKMCFLKGTEQLNALQANNADN